jgi:hypothetical protein
MATSLSMDGFEIRIKDQILEMRTEGLRTAGTGTDPARAFQSMVSSHNIKAVLFDIREAHYVLNEQAWAERARIVARLCKGFTTAFICRSDQTEQTKSVLGFHRDFGGTSEQFRSRALARDWLLLQIKSSA